MRTMAENIATGVAVLAAITILVSAACPHWLPSQDLPPPLVYADTLGQAMEWLLDRMLRLAAWLESAFESARFAAS